ncbi:aminoacyl-tRNA hydrolase [Ectothiorhodospiraceae bacterium BW-2]|nr:aminoacyl-tRNA hydrolase [Ectothiorhodospiraceae bacterium BW-2]
MGAIQIIAGLGNPGPQYQQTRHNAGFWLVDALAERCGASWQRQSRFQAEVAQITLNGEPVWLLKPMTFMNRSGSAIGALSRYYKIEAPEAILVAHDELDLPPGRVRLKQGGGHGGHNGLRDTISHLNSRDFWRLRLGIGHPGSAAEVTPYVLGSAPVSEQPQLWQMVQRTVEEIEAIVAGEFQVVMNRLHRD